tara:strand:+ start:787 stop:1128 length:342 start_codon:yes stop_codon:yes gene_type:complete
MIKLKLMKKFSTLLFLGIVILALQNCNAVNKAFVSERKNSTEEFLIEKKSPLSMPPSFNELPVPQNQDENVKDEKNDVKYLIQNTGSNPSESDKTENVPKKLEIFILEKIKNN